MITHDKETIIRKWSPLIKSMGFEKESEENLEKICLYADFHAKLESDRMLESTEMQKMYPNTVDLATVNTSKLSSVTSTVPLSLEILKGIKDKSKVRFMKNPVWIEDNKQKHVETVAIKYTGSPSRYHTEDLQYRDIDLVKEIEFNLVKDLTARINTLIEEGNIISFYIVVESIFEFISYTDRTIGIRSRFLAEPKSISINDL